MCKYKQSRSLSFLLALLLLQNLQSGEWAEETLKNMSLEEKVGQLFIVPVCPLRLDEQHQKDIITVLEKYRIGGIIIKQGTLQQQYETIRNVQSASVMPLFVVMDAEWGLSMRASDAQKFPRNMALGNVLDTSLIEKMGYQVGCQLHALGVHMNLAPVADVNSNPCNPIIRMRSFGEDPIQVAKKAVLFARGLRSAGVLACAKHFPGHGDTAVDSHCTLPTIPRTLTELEHIELSPFQMLIEDGIEAILSGHIVVPAIDVLPASLSYLCMTHLLREKMGFRGLLITDALNMQGLAKVFSTEEIATYAFKAGHHFLLYGDHIAPNVDIILEQLLPRAYESVKQAVLTGSITHEELDQRILQILETKEKLGLPFMRCPTFFQDSTFHHATVRDLAVTLYRRVIRIVQDTKHALPLHSLAVCVDDQGRGFADRLSARGVIIQPDSPQVIMTIPDTKTEQEYLAIQARLQAYIKQGKEIIAIVFGSHYILPYICPWAGTCIVAYEDCEEAWEAAADFCAFTQEKQVAV